MFLSAFGELQYVLYNNLEQMSDSLLDGDWPR